MLRNQPQIDILLSLKARIPTEPDGCPVSSAGSSHSRLLQRRTTKRLNFLGYPPIGLLDAMMIEQTKEKRKQLAKLGLHSLHS